jgi:hypothetical protein
MTLRTGFTTGNDIDAEVTAKGGIFSFDPADKPNYAPMCISVQQHELSSTPVDDTLFIMRVNPGMFVHEIVIRHDALNSSTELRIGDDDDDDRFFANFSTSSAGHKNLTEDGLIGGVSFFYDPSTFTDSEDIIATVKGAAATGTVVFQVIYSHANPGFVCAQPGGKGS